MRFNEWSDLLSWEHWALCHTVEPFAFLCRFADVLQTLGRSVAYLGKRADVSLQLSNQQWHNSDKEVICPVHVYVLMRSQSVVLMILFWLLTPEIIIVVTHVSQPTLMIRCLKGSLSMSYYDLCSVVHTCKMRPSLHFYTYDGEHLKIVTDSM